MVPSQNNGGKVDVNQAREYMKAKVEPIVGKLVQELAVHQPDNVLEFILNFAARELEATEIDGQDSAHEEKQAETLNAQESERPTAESKCADEAATSRSPPGRQCLRQETDTREESKHDEMQSDKQNHSETALLCQDQDKDDEEEEDDDDDNDDADKRVAESKALDSSDFESKMSETHCAQDTPSAEIEKPLVCCVSGTPAELKVRLAGSNRVELYARDIFEALKRKNKLRGAVAVELDEEFPEEENPEGPLWEYDKETLERIAAARTLDDVDARPVTPPKRGFKMTRPGENYHDETKRDGPINVGPVKFEARALGTLSGEGGNSEDAREAALKAAKRREKELEKNSRLSEEQRAALKLKRKKDDLIGKIRAHYASLGGAEPIGMAASSVETLQRHLSKIKAHTAANIMADVDVEERVLDLLEEAEDAAHEGGCELDRAFALTAKALYLSPNNPDVLDVRANIFLGVGDLSSAVVLRRKAYKLDTNASARRKRLAATLDAHGCILLEEGALKRARACFDEVLSLEPREASYWTHRTLAHLQAANVHAALADLNKAIEFDSTDGELYILRAKLFWDMQLQDKSMKDLKIAKELCNGFHPEITRFEHALTATSETGKDSISQCMLNGDFEAALVLLKKSLRANPANVTLLLQAATAARQLGDLNLALSYAQDAKKYTRRETTHEAKQLAKQEALIFNDQAASLISTKNDFKLALVKLNAAIDLCPEFEILYRNRGDCHRLLHDHNQAERDYQRAKELDPSDAEIEARLALLSYYKGQTAFNAGKYSAAETYFSSAISLSHGGQSEYFANRGLAKVCQGNAETALEDFQEALRLDPFNARARSWLAQSRSRSSETLARSKKTFH
ncbi:Tetratricopeptide repeat protein 16 [Hondaea fermentalgiana]|uniref:Tetratricopeptide repeat protein 16 n=1 Tax=Hondaea fermentalgiana TaxID=2315210 RepID=A0A2R5GTU8_9STRA|nr:Tetratricopeptide repeat protein 16 [Hondaea fermentalgiana]|eukprot:GBG34296.1 Tetratricopeptide repeat protein 16 [Hondaea fermentalgiana]